MESLVSRILRECGTTNKPFRLRYGFSKGTLTYAIAGTFAGLPGRLVDALCDLAAEKDVDLRAIYREYGATSINQAYNAWQSMERKAQVSKLDAEPPPFRFTEEQSPVHFWAKRLYGSTETLCKALKLPVATIQRWERGFTKGTPIIVQEVLHEMRYPYYDALVAAQNEWTQEFGGV